MKKVAIFAVRAKPRTAYGYAISAELLRGSAFSIACMMIIKICHLVISVVLKVNPVINRCYPS